jgi:hypothetical protein
MWVSSMIRFPFFLRLGPFFFFEEGASFSELPPLSIELGLMSGFVVSPFSLSISATNFLPGSVVQKVKAELTF